MIPLSLEASSALDVSHSIRVRAESWLGSELLAEDVPVIAATEEADRTLRVPERLSLTVPRDDDEGNSWAPIDAWSPLSAYGQRLRVSVGVELPDGAVEWLNRGWFLIDSSRVDADTVEVEAVGLLALVEEAQLVADYVPKAGATFASVVRALVEPALTVDDDLAPTDRAVPSGLAFSNSRLDCLLSILDAWPADAVSDPNGFLILTPADYVPSSAVFLTDGVGGTVMDWSGESSRDGAFTMVVARGQYPDTAGALAGTEITKVAHDLDPTSPYYRYGAFNPLSVPYEYFSPLLTTPAQVSSAATKVLARLRRTASRKITATCVPNPAYQLGDQVVVEAERLGLHSTECLIEGFTLPLLSDGGAMSLTLRVI